MKVFDAIVTVDGEAGTVLQITTIETVKAKSDLKTVSTEKVTKVKYLSNSDFTTKSVTADKIVKA